jgi:hypothetical protein
MEKTICLGLGSSKQEDEAGTGNENNVQSEVIFIFLNIRIVSKKSVHSVMNELQLLSQLKHRYIPEKHIYI